MEKSKREDCKIDGGRFCFELRLRGGGFGLGLGWAGGLAVELEGGGDHIANVMVLPEVLLLAGGDLPGEVAGIEEAFEAIVDTKLVVGVKGQRGFAIDDEVISAACAGGDGGAGAHCGQQQGVKTGRRAWDNENISGKKSRIKA